MLLCEDPELDQKFLMETASIILAIQKDDIYTIFEHGQWWVSCVSTGQYWSVVDVERNGASGIDFEEL